MRNTLKHQRGFTLVEILVALAIVAVALSAGLQATGALMQGPNTGGRGGCGGGFGGGAPPVGAISDPGFPAGFNARPAEARGAADSTGTPENQAKALIAAQNRAPTAGGAGGFGGGGGFGGPRPAFVVTGDYRIVLELPGQPNPSSQSLRMVRVSPDERAVLVPARR